MDAQTINRRIVTEVLGWQVYHYPKDKGTEYWCFLDPAEWIPIQLGNTDAWPTEVELWQVIPDFTTDDTQNGLIGQRVLTILTQKVGGGSVDFRSVEAHLEMGRDKNGEPITAYHGPAFQCLIRGPVREPVYEVMGTSNTFRLALCTAALLLIDEIKKRGSL